MFWHQRGSCQPWRVYSDGRWLWIEWLPRSDQRLTPNILALSRLSEVRKALAVGSLGRWSLSATVKIAVFSSPPWKTTTENRLNSLKSPVRAMRKAIFRIAQSSAVHRLRSTSNNFFYNVFVNLQQLANLLTPIVRAVPDTSCCSYRIPARSSNAKPFLLTPVISPGPHAFSPPRMSILVGPVFVQLTAALELFGVADSIWLQWGFIWICMNLAPKVKQWKKKKKTEKQLLPELNVWPFFALSCVSWLQQALALDGECGLFMRLSEFAPGFGESRFLNDSCARNKLYLFTLDVIITMIHYVDLHSLGVWSCTRSSWVNFNFAENKRLTLKIQFASLAWKKRDNSKSFFTVQVFIALA